MNIQSVLAQAKTQLAFSSTAQLDAEILLAHTLGKSKEFLYTWPELAITPTQLAAYQNRLAQRQQGQPIAYILQTKEFWSLPLQVTADTLIPRPETELLVELILKKFPDDHLIHLADLGTGSGAIALALAKERPLWKIIATDKSQTTLAIAKTNAENLNLPNIHFLLGDWLHACADITCTNFDVIVSNPPYIATHDPHLSQGDVRFEPMGALVAGTDGLDAIRTIIVQAHRYLKSQGFLMLEHGYEQGGRVRELLHKTGYKNIMTHRDLAGLERVTEATANIE